MRLQHSTESFDKQALEMAPKLPAQAARADGDVEAAFSGAAKVVEAAYAYPFRAARRSSR